MEVAMKSNEKKLWDKNDEYKITAILGANSYINVLLLIDIILKYI